MMCIALPALHCSTNPQQPASSPQCRNLRATTADYTTASFCDPFQQLNQCTNSGCSKRSGLSVSANASNIYTRELSTPPSKPQDTSGNGHSLHVVGTYVDPGSHPKAATYFYRATNAIYVPNQLLDPAVACPHGSSHNVKTVIRTAEPPSRCCTNAQQLMPPPYSHNRTRSTEA